MKRHAFDPLSLVFGLLFAAGGALFFAGSIEVQDLANPVVWPAIIIGAGLLFLIPALVRARSDSEPTPNEAVEEPDATRTDA